MGEPKRSRQKYDRPKAPWNAERIKEENEIIRKYGLKNKKELWRAQTMLRNFRKQSKNLQERLRYNDEQARKEAAQLISRLQKKAILAEGATLDDILELNTESILGRRLQMLVYLKGFAATPMQARQFIVHGHTTVNGRRVTVPGYLVTASEEATITYDPKSPISNELHPARPKPDEFRAVDRIPGAPPESAGPVTAEAGKGTNAKSASGEPADMRAENKTAPDK